MALKRVTLLAVLQPAPTPRSPEEESTVMPRAPSWANLLQTVFA